VSDIAADKKRSSRGDFCLFGGLRREMAGLTARAMKGILSQICRTSGKTAKEILTAIYSRWITTLEWTTEHLGGYYHRDQKKSIRF
jgi:hypothetical protein